MPTYYGHTPTSAKRQAYGWSSQQLARRAGLSQACISSIETGRRASPSLMTASRIAKAFGMPLWVALRELTER
ncbi:helix-turn-helix transcriptional regulator [Alcaligenaceae bacterium]|nr:helix-turn-helix transcriptional regulator [Alcaligenaceae bacterium]